jgi:hypothetical protein
MDICTEGWCWVDAKFSFGVSDRVSSFTYFERFLHLFEIPILFHLYHVTFTNLDLPTLSMCSYILITALQASSR